MITDGAVRHRTCPGRHWLNFADVQTAIEAYTPLYALFLPRADFIRAANSLQLDETIAIYLAKILAPTTTWPSSRTITRWCSSRPCRPATG